MKKYFWVLLGVTLNLSGCGSLEDALREQEARSKATPTPTPAVVASPTPAATPEVVETPAAEEEVASETIDTAQEEIDAEDESSVDVSVNVKTKGKPADVSVVVSNDPTPSENSQRDETLPQSEKIDTTNLTYGFPSGDVAEGLPKLKCTPSNEELTTQYRVYGIDESQWFPTWYLLTKTTTKNPRTSEIAPLIKETLARFSHHRKLQIVQIKGKSACWYPIYYPDVNWPYKGLPPQQKGGIVKPAVYK